MANEDDRTLESARQHTEPKGKGKGMESRATELDREGPKSAKSPIGDSKESQSTPERPRDTETLLSRIGKSATGLWNDSFSTKDAGGLTQDLAGYEPSSSRKVQSYPSGSASNAAPGLEARPSTQAKAHQALSASQSTVNETEHPTEIQQFLASDFSASDPNLPVEGFSSSKGDSSAASEIPTHERLNLEPGPSTGHSARGINLSDGAAVVDLLSRPGDFEHFESDWQEEPNLPTNFLQKSPEESHRPGNPTQMDLIPNFDFDSASSAVGADQLQPWLDILDKYHDEVWGDMLPIVQQARSEIHEAKASGETDPSELLERPAVRRLQMLLKHIDPKGQP